ncbi:3'-5' exonuclease [Nocardia vaccinii]|uniref:3'-5' exonuclease n=1 Tax=Nocardia vaccinii TaxID=1822 RepID=UPI00082F81C1|nr:3'-5' exonuclease [Nocardia vaccinii]
MSAAGMIRGCVVRVPAARSLAQACAVRWARGVLADPDRVAVLDCETTGLPHAGAPLPHLVELAVLDGRGAPLVDSLIDPGVPIPAAASAVHGLTDADVCGAPRFEAVVPELAAAIRGRRVVIYNARFDVMMLGARLAAIQSPRDEGQAVTVGQRWLTCRGARPECAMRRAAAWRAVPGRSGWRRPRLGGDPGTAHRAAGDCHAVLRLLSAMAAGDHTTDLGVVTQRHA